MTTQLAKIVAAEALPYPLHSDDPYCYTLPQDHLPEQLWHEADTTFGMAKGEPRPVYVIDFYTYKALIESSSH